MDAHIYILLIMNDKIRQNTSKRGKGNNYTKFITFLYRNYIELLYMAMSAISHRIS